MKSLLENKKVKIGLIVVLILIVILFVIGLILNDANKINKQQDPKLQARERIEQVLEMAKAAKENNESYNSNEYLTNLLRKNNIMVNGNIVSANGYNFEIDRENLNINNELGSTNVDISSEVIGSTGKDASGRDLGKVALNITSNVPIDTVQIENVDGTIIQENVNSTTYEKEIDVVFGHTHIISVVTSDGKIKMHKITKEKPEPIKDPIESTEIRTGNPLNFTWEEIAEIAEIISNDNRITRNTQEFSLTYKGNNYTIGVGDYTTLAGKKVRIMGFNHDTLSNTSAYGEGKTNTYAGISFEFAECITTAQMNSSNTNANGWGAAKLRSTLNSTTINSLENKEYIKQVNKQYIATCNNANSVTTAQDKLWLLSCSEIWNNPFESGYAYGYAIAKEGEQYKYYANINANSSSENSNLLKKNNGSTYNWWLRSPLYNATYSANFCCISTGYCGHAQSRNTFGVACGFSI